MLRLLAVLLCCGMLLFAEQMAAYVVGVSDGDTIKVLDEHKVQHRVRLLGIDAPESSQPFGQKSKEYLSQLIFNKNVFVIYTEKDQYGRILGKVEYNGIDVNLKMVEVGLAWHYVYFAKKEKALAEAEKSARAKKLGLWSAPQPQPPWDYRRAKKRQKRNARVKEEGREKNDFY